MSNSQLQKISELKIAGEDYELAANGQAYLVQKTDEDAYGNPVSRIVELDKWLIDSIDLGVGDGTVREATVKVQDLLNHIVILQRALQSSRDRSLNVGKDLTKDSV